MAGLLVGVVGPSGVGKDSVMEAMAARAPHVTLIRRAITRSEHLGGEAFDGVTEAQFDTMIAAGDFALHWPAHGLRYGVPWSQLGGDGIQLVNLSRRVLGQAAAQFDQFVTLSLTAPVDVLAQRLATRGRESADDIADRLARAAFDLPKDAGPVIEIANVGPLEDTAAKALTALDRFQAESV
ncbi:MAG: phosphonate metabolism protein/1,5-bisphosphokinase (PRPP-forming) PhnN [Pseudomonadota bacterium]